MGSGVSLSVFFCIYCIVLPLSFVYIIVLFVVASFLLSWCWVAAAKEAYCRVGGLGVVAVCPFFLASPLSVLGCMPWSAGYCAFRVIDVVCLWPVSLPLFGFHLAGLIDVVYFGPVFIILCLY